LGDVWFCRDNEVGSPKKERIYCGKDGQREALPIFTYLALPSLFMEIYPKIGLFMNMLAMEIFYEN